MGTLRYSATRLTSSFENTPLGVADGTFQATLRDTAEGRLYTSIGQSARDTRKIQVLFSNGQARQTQVTPETERTNMSDPKAVPANVTDPVQALGRFITTQDCPKPFRFYDGRRVLAVAPKAQSRDAQSLICSFSYNVIAGPGHLSPFRFTSLQGTAIYDLAKSPAALSKLMIKTGPFALRLTRQ